jgi:hypothetical protein
LKSRAERENTRFKDAVVAENKAQNELGALKNDISNAEESLMTLAPKVFFNSLFKYFLV